LSRGNNNPGNGNGGKRHYGYFIGKIRPVNKRPFFDTVQFEIKSIIGQILGGVTHRTKAFLSSLWILRAKICTV